MLARPKPQPGRVLQIGRGLQLVVPAGGPGPPQPSSGLIGERLTSCPTRPRAGVGHIPAMLYVSWRDDQPGLPICDLLLDGRIGHRIVDCFVLKR